MHLFWLHCSGFVASLVSFGATSGSAWHPCRVTSSGNTQTNCVRREEPNVKCSVSVNHCCASQDILTFQLHFFRIDSSREETLRSDAGASCRLQHDVRRICLHTRHLQMYNNGARADNLCERLPASGRARWMWRFVEASVDFGRLYVELHRAPDAVHVKTRSSQSPTSAIND